MSVRAVARWLNADLRMLVFNAIGGVLFFLFFVEPYFGERYWFIACIPVAVSIIAMLFRPLYNRIRTRARDR